MLKNNQTLGILAMMCLLSFIYVFDIKSEVRTKLWPQNLRNFAWKWVAICNFAIKAINSIKQNERPFKNFCLSKKLSCDIKENNELNKIFIEGLVCLQFDILFVPWLMKYAVVQITCTCPPKNYNFKSKSTPIIN